MWLWVIKFHKSKQERVKNITNEWLESKQERAKNITNEWLEIGDDTRTDALRKVYIWLTRECINVVSLWIKFKCQIKIVVKISEKGVHFPK